MSVYVFAIVNAVLATLVVGAIPGLLLWSLLTQHRDPGCADVRLRPHQRRRRVVGAVRGARSSWGRTSGAGSRAPLRARAR